MVKKTPIDKHQQILKLKEEGKSTREIAKIVGCSNATVSRIKPLNDQGKHKAKIGRPRELDMHDVRYICRLVSTGKCGTATQVQQELRDYTGILVSANTILRVLCQNGYHSCLKKKRPQLKKSHRAARCQFEKHHRNWGLADWSKVIWSDETKICLKGSDSRDRCFHKDGERLQDHHVTPTWKFSAGSIMVWGCMLASGVGYLCRVDGGINAEMYQNILADELMRTLKWFDLDKSKIIFQQDNASCHTAETTKKWFKDHGIAVMKWPAQSPDLNPIEHLWDNLKRKVRELPPAKNLDELWDRVQDAWNSISPDECKALVDSMPKRLASVREAKGGYTKHQPFPTVSNFYSIIFINKCKFQKTYKTL